LCFAPGPVSCRYKNCSAETGKTPEPQLMNEIKVRHERNKTSGRYVADLGSGLTAKMTYSRLGVCKIAIDHTHVPEKFRGQGIAMKLLEFAIKQARINHDKIVPMCSYVQEQFELHEQWSDVLADMKNCPYAQSA